MRILICSNFFYPRGGDCTYMFALADLLRRYGHEVLFFSMKHSLNRASEQQDYFVDFIDYERLNQSKTLTSAGKVLWRSIYSTQAGRRLRNLLHDLKPDVAHLQNIHAHLTPSILVELNRAGVPVVWTLHDFKLLCPESSFLSGNEICEACRDRRFYQCTVRRCKKGSWGASAVASLEAYAHLFLRIPERVRWFIAPSQFLFDEFMKFGWPRDRLVFMRNFLAELPSLGARESGYGLYAGNLHQKKGLRTLLRALDIAGNPPFRIAGEGPIREELEEEARRRGLDNLRFLGLLNGQELAAEENGAGYGVLASECYENCPYFIMEMMAKGKPMVGSNLGGIPELIAHGETGWLFRAGDIQDLAQKLVLANGDAGRARHMGRRARAVAEASFSAEQYYEQLLPLYQEVTRADPSEGAN